MMRLFSLFFLFVFAPTSWADQLVFQGRVELGRDLASFERNPPIFGTLYLLSGSASSVRILSQTPFVAEVDFIQGEWQSESDLVAHHTTLRFEGDVWAERVQTKKPRQGGTLVVYPYRKFQVAAVAGSTGFRVTAVTVFF